MLTPKQRKIRRAVRIMFYAPMIALALAAFGYAITPPCATEDSINCVWHASEQGNGEGRSFIDVGGMVVYLP